MNDEALDAAQQDAQKRFDALKAEGVAIEARMKADRERLSDVHTEMARVQGEYRAIQNLRKKPETEAAPAADLPAKKDD